MKEQNFQSKIVKYLESEGAYVVKVVKANKNGVPDIVACYKGYFLAIEVKTPTTRANTSPLQDYNLKLIASAGGIALVAVDVADIVGVIRHIQRRANEN